jgi:hypothetical protein
MAIAVNIVWLVASAAMLVGYPWFAVRAWRAGGAPALLRTAVAAIAIIVAFGLILGTETFGNMHTATYGYASVARGVVTTFLGRLGIPVVLASVAVAVTPRNRPSVGGAYAIALGASVVGWVVGMIGTLWVWSAMR